MASSASNFLISCLLVVALSSGASAQLSPTFYDTSCPNALSTIRTAVNAAVAQEARMGASLVRLHFHDCFVQGCDASVLLNDTNGEQTALPNNGSLRGFGVIDNIKAQVETLCPQTVSCADILAVAARDSVVAVSYISLARDCLMMLLLDLLLAVGLKQFLYIYMLYIYIYMHKYIHTHTYIYMQLGGPSWTVPLGRRDSTASFPAQALSDLPPPQFSLSQLIGSFGNKTLDVTDMVALSGAHTIGQAQCLNFRDHITEPNINATFAASLRANCPAAVGSGDTNLAPLDVTTPNTFDNAYYSNLLSQRGLLHSDQELFNNGSTDSIVRNFASNPSAFTSAFATAMVKMGNLQPLTGTKGQIRRNCWRVNS